MGMQRGGGPLLNVDLGEFSDRQISILYQNVKKKNLYSTYPTPCEEAWISVHGQFHAVSQRRFCLFTRQAAMFFLQEEQRALPSLG
jgi:hypothetical protein